MSKVALLPPIAVSAAQPCTTACVLVTGLGVSAGAITG